MTREEAVALLERYSNYEGMGIPNLAGCKEAMKVAAEALKEAYPELKESEDERIRKALVWHLKADVDFVSNGVTKAECIAYLEKQKEQKPVQSEEEKEYVRTLKGLVSDFIRDSGGGITDIEYYQNICDWLDGRHIEQKPNIEICPHSIKSKSYKENGYPIEDCDYGLEIAQDILEKTLGKVEGYQSDDGIREHLTAIQAVKDAMKEQKPAEWSQEDEKDMAHIIRILDDCYVYGTHDLSKTDHENLVNKLKSLRPSWKPSEEQMKAFKGYIEDFQAKAEAAVGGWNNFDVMIRLYEQLKKL